MEGVSKTRSHPGLSGVQRSVINMPSVWMDSVCVMWGSQVCTLPCTCRPWYTRCIFLIVHLRNAQNTSCKFRTYLCINVELLYRKICSCTQVAVFQKLWNKVYKLTSCVLKFSTAGDGFHCLPEYGCESEEHCIANHTYCDGLNKECVCWDETLPNAGIWSHYYSAWSNTPQCLVFLIINIFVNRTRQSL